MNPKWCKSKYDQSTHCFSEKEADCSDCASYNPNTNFCDAWNKAQFGETITDGSQSFLKGIGGSQWVEIHSALDENWIIIPKKKIVEIPIPTKAEHKELWYGQGNNISSHECDTAFKVTYEINGDD